MRTVQVMSAGEFVCDKCGRNNYFCWAAFDPSKCTPEEIVDLMEFFDCDDLAVDLWTEPDVVTCSHCKTDYEICNEFHKDCTHTRPTVETFQAGEFSCPDCNCHNFFCVVTVDRSMIEREDGGTISQEGGDFIILPDTVTCEQCGAKFIPEG